jgi:hypothetical protein
MKKKNSKEIEKVNIFVRKVSVFTRCTDKVPTGETTISEVLKNHGFEALIKKYRKSKLYRDKKKLPAFTCSGVFRERTNEGIIKHNGVVCIDIDRKDNPDVENFDKLSASISFHLTTKHISIIKQQYIQD